MVGRKNIVEEFERRNLSSCRKKSETGYASCDDGVVRKPPNRITAGVMVLVEVETGETFSR